MDVKSILQIIGGTGEFTDAFGNGAISPGVTLGVVTDLVFDLRGGKTQDDPELPAYDLPDADSYYIAIDNDWSKATAPKLLRTTGISVDKSTGYTILTVPLPDTGSVPELASLLEAAKTLTLHCEIGGIKEGVGDVFAYSFDLVIRNRVWLPDSSPEDLPSDPDYLNTTEVQAYINAAIAAALENITGDTGPAPTITMGTVTTGANPEATLTPVTGDEGAYTLDLVMPVVTGPTGPARQFGIGTITDGTEAAASLDLDGETYLLSITLPRGKDGINPRGQWAVGTTYALNDVIRHAAAWWRSLQDDNTGNEPPATRIDNAWWEIVVKDGLDAEPLLRAYNDNDDPDDEDWHTTMLPGDTHFRESIDGGASWTIPKALTASQGVIELYNVDAIADWAALTPGTSYSTGFGKFMRARQDGGVWGVAYQIHDLSAQALRVQFSSGGVEPTWHATLQAGDKLAKFYNTASTINQTVTISDGTFDVAEIQLCAVADPWHVTYDSATDTYRKISVDGGATYTDPMPLRGKSAYQEWLDLGNTGTTEDFLDSLKGADGTGEGGGTTPLSDSNPLGLGLVSAGVATSAARADHVHPVTGLVLSSEKGVVMGVATLGLDGRVPATQLPEMSGSGGLSITRLRLARPSFDDATHLVVEAAVWQDFSDAARVIDTAAVAADREKVIGFAGSVFVACPVDGFGGAFSRQTILIDLAGLVTVPSFIRYKWVASGGDSDWYATYFPSTGEAYVAPPASTSGGETPATTFGTLKVDITGATGQWSADGGSTWHDSGDTITVATGTHTVTFAYVTGYTTPSSQSVTISDGILTTVSAEYYEIEVPTETEGTLVVNITGASNGSWSIDSGTTWKASGQSLLLTAGSYTITFEPILGYSKPDDIPVTVVAGNITVKSGAYVAQPDSSDPTDYGMTWDNGTEPVLEEGNKVIFVTPTGAGNYSGDSWANAKAGLYTAGMAASDGDVLYVQEGTYTNHLAPVAGTKSIGIYGGFTVADGTWATRDGFANPTVIDASSNPSVPFIKPESGVTQVVDGIACTGFTGGAMLANGGTATVKNCAIYDCEGAVSSHAVDNCLVLNCTGGTGAATDCVFVKMDTIGGITAGGATNCTFTNCSSSYFAIVTGGTTNCTFTNCSCSSSSSGGNRYIVGTTATDCTFTNCSSNSNVDSSYIVRNTATDCTFTNCSCSSNSISYCSYIVGSTATNCTFTNCSSSSRASYIVGGGTTNCTFTNCSSIGSYINSKIAIVVGGATNCTFTNCSSSNSNYYGSNIAIVTGGTTNCTFTNCSSGNSSYSYIVGGGTTNCTFVRCKAGGLRYNQSGNDITNCVIFGCPITAIDFGAGTNNAASAYIDANTLVLGTDNTLANFASLGTVEIIGYSADLNDTPAADFGDFRPMVGSVLIGAGVAVSGITEDIAGNLRPDPPTIGAYEYVEEA